MLELDNLKDRIEQVDKQIKAQKIAKSNVELKQLLTAISILLENSGNPITTSFSKIALTNLTPEFLKSVRSFLAQVIASPTEASIKKASLKKIDKNRDTKLKTFEKEVAEGGEFYIDNIAPVDTIEELVIEDQK